MMWTLATGASRLQEVQDAVRGTGISLEFLPSGRVLAAVASLAGLILLAVAMTSLIRRDLRACGPVWRDVCRSLGLDTSQRRVLVAVARFADLPSPTSLVISRGCFDWATRRFTGTPEQRRALNAVRRKVFDG